MLAPSPKTSNFRYVFYGRIVEFIVDATFYLSLMFIDTDLNKTDSFKIVYLVH
jgi:hypothetical protein